MSTTTDWFATRELSSGTWLVAEPTHVNSYLVAGTDRAVLIDSGLGIGDIRSIVQSLTPLDVLVANTHHHWDHVGGNSSFDEIAIHELGAERLRAGNEMRFADAYVGYACERLERFGEFRDLDRRFFDFLSEETTPRPLPPGFDPAAWTIAPCLPSRLLRDGDVLDLGGRSLRVVHTPGHTPDSVCYLDADRGMLFGGDTFNTGALYAHLPESDLEAFAASTARVRAMEDDVGSVYMAHVSRYAEHGSFLSEVADGFAAIMAGDVTWEEGAEEGHPYKACWFARFGVYAHPDAVKGLATGA